MLARVGGWRVGAATLQSLAPLRCIRMDALGSYVGCLARWSAAMHRLAGPRTRLYGVHRVDADVSEGGACRSARRLAAYRRDARRYDQLLFATVLGAHWYAFAIQTPQRRRPGGGGAAPTVLVADSDVRGEQQQQRRRATMPAAVRRFVDALFGPRVRVRVRTARCPQQRTVPGRQDNDCGVFALLALEWWVRRPGCVRLATTTRHHGIPSTNRCRRRIITLLRRMRAARTPAARARCLARHRFWLTRSARRDRSSS